jgi:hypothetical protein
MKSNNAHLIIFALTNVFISLYISGCSSGENRSATTQPTVNIPTAQPPVRIPTAQDIANIVYDENYLKDCKSKYSESLEQQADFQGIYAGISTKDEVFTQFGEPTKVGNIEGGKEYLYFDADVTYAYHFYVVNNIVTNIVVSLDKFSLQNVLEEYGCPDLIVAATLGPDDYYGEEVVVPTEYTNIYFYYLKSGVSLNFYKYPIHYSDIPDMIYFDKPYSMNYFLDNIFDPQSSKVVEFSEAVVSE